MARHASRLHGIPHEIWHEIRNGIRALVRRRRRVERPGAVGLAGATNVGRSARCLVLASLLTAALPGCASNGRLQEPPASAGGPSDAIVIARDLSREYTEGAESSGVVQFVRVRPGTSDETARLTLMGSAVVLDDEHLLLTAHQVDEAVERIRLDGAIRRVEATWTDVARDLAVVRFSPALPWRPPLRIGPPPSLGAPLVAVGYGEIGFTGMDPRGELASPIGRTAETVFTGLPVTRLQLVAAESRELRYDPAAVLPLRFRTRPYGPTPDGDFRGMSGGAILQRDSDGTDRLVAIVTGRLSQRTRGGTLVDQVLEAGLPDWPTIRTLLDTGTWRNATR